MGMLFWNRTDTTVCTLPQKNDHCGVSNKSTHHLRIMSIDCKTEAKRATELIDSILSKIVAIGVSMKNNDNHLEWRCR